ncbi:MAG: preprotein translocase subunit SecE [Desulfobacteraceae bacterium]|jgi:preprotein translocase subunit SecE|nr:preprotein translocase subunit SecE [Desulfobacteraceae bacterium]
MARLQRKKTSKPKKKSSESAGSASVNEAADAQAGKTTAVAATAKEVRKPTPAAQKKMPSAPRSEPNKVVGWFNTSVQFLREVKVELKKVAWPSRKQTVGSTIVVLILVTIIAFFLGAADIGLSSLIQVVLQ